MTVAEDIQVLLTGTNEQKQQVIEDRTRNRLRNLLGGVMEVPEELEYILVDVSIKRFNRIQNEGMNSYSEEGLSITFQSSDFDEYLDEINAWLKRQEPEDDTKKRGRFRLY